MAGSADKQVRKESPAHQGARPQKRLGEIFVERGLLTPMGVERLVALSKKAGKRFGTLLEDLGLVTGYELADALAAQYCFRVIRDFHRHQFPPALLRIVPVNVAVEHTLFPLKVEGNKLAVAISDPTNMKVMQNIGANNNLIVIPFIATREDINKAITLHYLNRKLDRDNRKRILLVEDDKLVRTMLTNSLEKQGYFVAAAEDGMEAFREVIAIQPDLIITDKEMPKLSGYAFFDSIRNFPETSRTPVILISSTATAEEEEAAYVKGFFDYIPKPVKEATLLVKVKRAIAGTAIV